MIGVQLPEANALRLLTLARPLLRQCPQAREAPPSGGCAARRSTASSRCWVAKHTDLSAVDPRPGRRAGPFDRRVYAVARTIACGATRSYGEIAVELGERSLARDVGQALGRNPFPLIVPCHRVLAAGGKLGGFSANGGVTTKLRLLTIERARTSHAPILFEDDSAFSVLTHR